MRRLKLLTVLAALTGLLGVTLAPDGTRAQMALATYRNEALGLTFQHPADWVIQEQMAAQTVTAASGEDLAGIAAGRIPQGLIFTVTMTSLGQLGAASTEDFPAILERISGSSAPPEPVRMGGANGLAVTVNSLTHDMTARTAILSTGRRRAAVVRGLATQTGWSGGGASWFAALTSTLGFFPPANGLEGDSVTAVLWQLPATNFSELSGLAASPDGTALYASDRSRGVWAINPNGVPGTLIRPAGVAAFAGIAARNDGSVYVADPVAHALWLLPGDGSAQMVFGGRAGTGRGEFGPESPQRFDFAPRNIYILDENASGLRLHVLNLAGRPVTVWDVSPALGIVENPLIATDGEGNAYILGRNTGGIVRVNASGGVSRGRIGADVLAAVEPLALALDGFRNFYVATADQGILRLSADGALMSVIGEPYDESAPLKPGQLGRPVALAITADGSTLFVADAGLHPQIVAFAVEGNRSGNLRAGTRDGGSMSYGQVVTGTISAEAFLYTYTFEGRAGDVATITMRAADNSPLDAFVDLLGPDNRRVAANDDSGAEGLRTTDAQIARFPLPVSGRYTIRATRFGREVGGSEGMYILSLERAQ